MTSQVVPLIKQECLYLTPRPAVGRASEWRTIVEEHNRDWGSRQARADAPEGTT